MEGLTDSLQLAQVKPKAARVLGLDNLEWRRSHDTEDQTMLLTPESLRSEAGVSNWVPEWPEPEEPPQTDDPLRVWRQEAALPQLAGVPRGATNAWRRRNGLQLPLDPLFALQWAAAAALGGGFMGVVRPLAQTIVGPAPLMDALGIAGQLLVAAAMVASLVTSWRDPQAPEAATAVRDLFFQQQWGMPAIDPGRRLCRVCCVTARPGTRHCKRCNKCVAHMDHHCRWLNTCIGSRNYLSFFACLCLSLLALLSVLLHSGLAVLVAARDPPRFVSMACRFAGSGPCSVHEPTPAAIAAMCALAVYTVAALASLVMVSMLLSLHVRLCVLQTTTIEFEAQKEREKLMREQEEMIPMTSLDTISPIQAHLHGPSSTLLRRSLRVARKTYTALRHFAGRKLRRNRYRAVRTQDMQ
ncbi:hypothetical protein IWW40_005526 [Coemansia sp. RSA 1250]|nr:hypothetical protein IWW40_005526 [Coemansia sp. RSA 1250]